MYFPYLRGRQYELLALRELVSSGLLSTNILPVVEPVKLSSTLSKTMEEFIRQGRKLAIICNPAVGSFNSDMSDAEKDINRQRFLDLLDNPYIVKSHIMKADSQAQILSWKDSKNVQAKDWLVICNNRDYVESYKCIFGEISPQYVLIPDEFRRKIRRKKVLFEDKFEKCDRNSDYLKQPDEFFSEDHIFYDEEGYIGFGDYSVIGKDYLEAGFAPMQSPSIFYILQKTIAYEYTILFQTPMMIFKILQKNSMKLCRSCQYGYEKTTFPLRPGFLDS